MPVRIATLAVASLVTAALDSFTCAHADRRSGGDAMTAREVTLNVEPGAVEAWKNAKPGADIVIPWFDQQEFVATVDSIETTGRTLSVVARVADELTGNVILTFSEAGLFGAMTVGPTTYRLRQRDQGPYMLAEVDGGRYELDELDTAELDDVGRQPPQRQKAPPVVPGLLRPGNLLRIITREALDVSDLEPVSDDGSRIDIVVAYTTEARDWAEANGYPLLSAITAMIVETNVAFQYSGVQTRLRLVGTAEVEYSVLDGARMAQDLTRLSVGIDNLAGLHVLRDDVGADLVSLLVMNGEEEVCGADLGRACGRAMVPRRYPYSGEAPRSPSWDAYYDDKGFSIVHFPAAVNYHTFKHEVAHNLGAHHDLVTFVQDGTAATAEDYARGWVLFEHDVRTVMSYDRLCAFNEKTCPTVPRFSNPNLLWQNMPGAWLGDPAPGQTRRFLGPADNVSAMNKMALTVANYRSTRAP